MVRLIPFLDQGSCSVNLISRRQSLYCTWKVKIIFCQIGFDISDEIFLTSFSELTETRFGGWGITALQSDAGWGTSVAASTHAASVLLPQSTHEIGQFPMFATKFPLTLSTFEFRNSLWDWWGHQDQSHAHSILAVLSPAIERVQVSLLFSLTNSSLPRVALPLAGGAKRRNEQERSYMANASMSWHWAPWDLTWFQITFFL